jgi:hypothetical protein
MLYIKYNCCMISTRVGIVASMICAYLLLGFGMVTIPKRKFAGFVFNEIRIILHSDPIQALIETRRRVQADTVLIRN